MISGFEKITADEILKISSSHPEKLFWGVDTLDELKKSYRKLSSLWHPDKSLENKEVRGKVFSHINHLYEFANKKFENDVWNQGLAVVFETIEGKKFQLKYLKQSNFDLGTYFVADTCVVWLFSKENEDLAENFLESLKQIKYANKKMQEEMQKYIPVIQKTFKTKDGFGIVIEKNSDFLCLKDVWEYEKNKMPSRHVAWILSNCYHLACFFEYNQLMYGGFSMENIYINPKTHAVCLLGGWWSTHANNCALKALSSQAFDVAPIEMLNDKKALTKLDLEMIRLLGRKLLGDTHGFSLQKDKDIPAKLIQWLRDTAKFKAFKEYEIWHETILKESFGARRFIKMELSKNDIYN